MRVFRFAIAGLAILTLMSIRTDSWPWPQTGSEHRHRTGIVLLGPIDLDAISRMDPLSDPLRKAWNDAFTLAQEGHPDLFGYPWADRTSGELVIAVASPTGEAMARQWMQSGLQVGSPKPGGPFTIDLPAPQVPVRISSARSITELRQVMDGVIDMTRSGVPGAGRIYSAGPDPEHDRIIVETDRVDDQLLEAIVSRFGVDVIAVRVNPNGNPFNVGY
jgi:hypothetical protein